MVSCIEPGAVTPEELLAHADGQAPERVLAHLRRCSSCRDEARGYADWQRALRQRLRRFDCPSPHTLGEYQLGVLPAEEGRLIAAHGASCPRCADELRVLRSFLASEPEPSLGLTDRVRRIVARLVAAPLGPVGVGLRGAGQSQTYRAEGLGVALTATTARRGRGAFVGLVWLEERGRAELGGVATLVGSDGQSRQAPIDGQGNFAFEDLPAGVGQLTLLLADAIVVVEDVPVGST